MKRKSQIDDIIPLSNDSTLNKEEVTYDFTYDGTEEEPRKQFKDIGKLTNTQHIEVQNIIEEGYGIVKQEEVKEKPKKKAKTVMIDHLPKAEVIVQPKIDYEKKYYNIIKAIILVVGLIVLFTVLFIYLRSLYNKYTYLNPNILYSGVERQTQAPAEEPEPAPAPSEQAPVPAPAIAPALAPAPSIEERAQELARQELAARKRAEEIIKQQTMVGGGKVRARDDKGRFISSKSRIPY